jgi:hypothetical protein
MTIHEAESWSEMLTPATDEQVARYVDGAKAWLMRSGGVMAVRRAELVGAMLVLSGVDVVSGHACAASVPVAEVAARAA